MHAPLSLRVLVFQENETWVAQVIERDMAAHGPTPRAALNAVLMVIQAHVNFDVRNGRRPLSTLKEAPDVYWKAIERARPMSEPSEALRFMNPAEIHPAITDERLAASAC